MCFGGSGSKVQVPTVPPAIDTEKKEAAAYDATQKEVTAAKQRAGRSSTILTSPLGVKEEADVKKKTLLGQ